MSEDGQWLERLASAVSSFLSTDGLLPGAALNRSRDLSPCDQWSTFLVETPLT